jgi:hypothetical protein
MHRVALPLSGIAALPNTAKSISNKVELRDTQKSTLALRSEQKPQPLKQLYQHLEIQFHPRKDLTHEISVIHQHRLYPNIYYSCPIHSGILYR